MTQALLFIHILLFVFSFAFTAGISILGDMMIKTGDAKTIQATFRVIVPLSTIGGIVWLLTGVAGATLAGAYGYSLTAPWLVGAYVLFALLLIVGFGLHLPWDRKVVAAAPGPELDAVLKAPIHKIASAISSVCILGLVFLMIFRPG